jgi:glycosyltransferase involved in cell wall biosynthesis
MLRSSYQRIPHDLVDDVIVTDNASTDGSYEIAQSLGVPVFRNASNIGYGGNVKAGIRQALARGADYIVEVHGDGQYDPSALRPALPHIADGADFILGSRFIIPGRARANAMPLVRFVANRLLSTLDRRVLGLPLTEFHTGFRVYGRRFLERVAWESNSDDYLFSFEILAQAAYVDAKVAEVPVEGDYRGDHTSIPLGRAALYSLQTLASLTDYVLARRGVRHTHVFPPP